MRTLRKAFSSKLADLEAGDVLSPIGLGLLIVGLVATWWPAALMVTGVALLALGYKKGWY